MSSTAGHPYIGFIVGELREIFHLMGNGREGMAIENLHKLLHTVDPQAREKNNWSELDAELRKIKVARNKLRGGDPVVVQGKIDKFDWQMRDNYLNMISRIWRIMWDNDYMYEARYVAFWDSAKGRGSDDGVDYNAEQPRT